MAADVRRWGEVLPAHVLVGGTHPGHVGRERKVGGKGHVGGPAGTPSEASAKRAHKPTLSTAAFPTHNTLSTLGKSQLDKTPQRPGPPGGGGGPGAWCWAGGGGAGGRGSTS